MYPHHTAAHWKYSSVLVDEFDDLERATEQHVALARGGHMFSVSSDYLFRDNSKHNEADDAGLS